MAADLRTVARLETGGAGVSDISDDNKKIAADFLRDFVAMLSGEATTCIRCGQPFDKLKQVGRCVYAEPCGCRQYQGKVPKKARKP